MSRQVDSDEPAEPGRRNGWVLRHGTGWRGDISDDTYIGPVVIRLFSMVAYYDGNDVLIIRRVINGVPINDSIRQS